VRKVIVTSVALLAMTTAAKALTFEQKLAIGAVYYAMYAGLDDHCPRMKFNYAAGHDELASVGINIDQLDNDPAVAAARHDVLMPVIVSYHRNPSALCSAAWSKFGANGDYKRQMLDAK
jgi:hypothetical protein